MGKLINKPYYRSLVMLMLRYSNNLALIMVLIAIYVCFSKNTWLYITILGMSSIYLGWLTFQYILSESDRCQWQMRSLQYDCQIATFNNRLSIVSNLIVALFGAGFSILMVEYISKENMPLPNGIPYISVTYMIGFFKMLMMYVISDKIHTSQLIINILYKYSQSMRHLILDVDKANPSKRYPIIYLDGYKISQARYSVNDGGDVIGITFAPSLSLGNDSIIEYELIEEDDNHKLMKESICDETDRITCLFKCRNVVRKLKRFSPLNETINGTV